MALVGKQPVDVDVPPVDVDETVWRSVKPGDVKDNTPGQLKLSSSAFNDRGKQPSVDRKKLRNSPEESKLGENDGVVALDVIEIRKLSVRQPNSPEASKSDATYNVDVIADPLPDNPAHALIVCDPKIEKDKPFRRLKEMLARLAEAKGWVIPSS